MSVIFKVKGEIGKVQVTEHLAFFRVVNVQCIVYRAWTKSRLVVWDKHIFLLGKLLFNSLSPNIHLEILHTDFYMFPWKTSWENLLKDQSIFQGDHFSNSHNFFFALCIDSLRRKLMLIILRQGSRQVIKSFTKVVFTWYWSNFQLVENSYG